MPRPDPPARQRPALPAGFVLEAGEPELAHDGGYRHMPDKELAPLVVRCPWSRGQAPFLSFLAGVWDVLTIALAAGIVIKGPVDAITLSLLSFFTVFAVSGTYVALAARLNFTTLRVRDGVLSVRRGPLPWPGDRTVPAAGVRQLFLRKKEERVEGRRVTSWELHAQIGELATLVLLSDVPLREQVEYIEWVVEQHLGIVDEPSRNEG